VSSEALVREFWRLMGTNDFSSVASVLSEDFVLEWPQGGERIRGAANFAQVNSEYPSVGPWRFEVDRIVAADHNAVSDVRVTDGETVGRAISFFSIAEGKITKIVEYWPEPFEAPEQRRHLVD